MTQEAVPLADLDDSDLMSMTMAAVNTLAERRKVPPMVIVGEYLHALTVEAVENGTLQADHEGGIVFDMGAFADKPTLVDADGNPLI